VDWFFQPDTNKYGFGFGTGSSSLPITSDLSDAEVVIDGGNGNVGIGTTSPGSLLHVEEVGGQGVARIEGRTGNTVNPTILELMADAPNQGNNGLPVGRIDFMGDGDNGERVMAAVRSRVTNAVETRGTLEFITSGAEAMRITDGGSGQRKVGIGTTSPDTQLDVDGSTRTRDTIREGLKTDVDMTADDLYATISAQDSGIWNIIIETTVTGGNRQRYKRWVVNRASNGDVEIKQLDNQAWDAGSVADIDLSYSSSTERFELTYQGSGDSNPGDDRAFTSFKYTGTVSSIVPEITEQ
jgi:hypothetical protein